MPDWLKAPWLQELWQTTSQRLPTLAAALGILIGGWLLAYIFQKLVHAGLKRTTIDDKIATAIGIDTGGDYGDRIERIIAKTVYYIVLAFVLVAFFGYLKIDAVTQPLVTLLNGFAGAVPNLLKAALIALGGYLLARLVRRLILTLFGKIGLERRMMKLTGEEAEAEPPKKKGKAKKPAEQPLTSTLAEVAYWFILVVVAIPVFEALKISALAAPLSAAFETITTYLPKVGGAAVLMIVGYVVARVVRAVVAGALEKVGMDRAVSRLGFGAVTQDHPLSGMLGTLAMTFVLLQFAISAVGRLELAEISGPLSMMLERVYGYLPKLLVGGVLMAIGVLISKVAGNLSSRLLAAMGFNTLVTHIGLFKGTAGAKKQEDESKKMVDERLSKLEVDEEEEAPESEGAEPDELLSAHGTKGIQTPADVAGVAVATIVVLLFLRQVLGTLELTGLAVLLDGLLKFLPHALVAIVVLGAGLWAGGWAHKRIDELTARSQDRMMKALGHVAHIAIVVFSAMVALQQLGVGRQLIAIAFGLLLGAVCLALALAFGLGGREVAGKVLAKEYDKRSK